MRLSRYNLRKMLDSGFDRSEPPFFALPARASFLNMEKIRNFADL